MLFFAYLPKEKIDLKKSKTAYYCQHCGYMSPKWLVKCPSCNGWNCFAEELIVNSGSDSRSEMTFDGKPMLIQKFLIFSDQK